MKYISKWIVLFITHGAALAGGIALGIYLLPILIAPTPPTAEAVDQVAQRAVFHAELTPDLAGSDLLHWGDGTVYISSTHIAFAGRLAPGPDYKLYLSPHFVQTEKEFHQFKSRMVRVGDVNTFDKFIVRIPDGMDVAGLNTVVVWCEAFGQFISAGRYR